MLYQNVVETIGLTPLIKLNRLKEQLQLKGNVYVKVEAFNPGGSVKDRIAYQMIKDALDKKEINETTHLVEATSGNTGVGLAMVASAFGLKLTIVMPSTMSIERQKLIKGYGAALVLTDGSLGMKGAIAKAQEILKEDQNAKMMLQFENPSNPKAHLLHTGIEILNDLPSVDVFVAGVGTGGTITGVGSYLKSKKSDVKIYAVEPVESAVLSGKQPGPHKIQGIGAGFVPEVLKKELIDDIIQVSSEQAISRSKQLMQAEGIMAGISSGAALEAGIQLALQEEFKDKDIVVLLPDTAERYLSTVLFGE
ncbi:cysteine synthase A [Erysipelotrichaceae bacterium OH741_COT-311]|nr:cysteine synthase A [Erysipelotrichaceae bacterium]RRC91225.1 cysteine synthase A [Erysipelotrichaceae bacterium OH741_COT-311]